VEKIKKFKMGFLNKLVVSYSIVILIFILILIGIAYNYIVSVSQQTASINQSQLLNKISSQVEYYLDEMYKMGSQVASDTRIINMFNVLQEEGDPENYFEYSIMDSIEAGSILTSYNAPDYLIWRISVFNQYGDYMSDGIEIQNQTGEEKDKLNVERLMDELQSQPFLLFFQNDADYIEEDEYSDMTMSMLLPITNYYADEIYGIVEIQQNMENFQQFIALDQLEDSATVYLLDQEMNQILPRDNDYNSLDKDQYYITYESVNTYGWNLALAVSLASMTKPYQGILGYIILVSFIIVISLILTIYIITKRITTPLTNLSKSVRHITLDNVPEDLVKDESMDEVRELNTAFTAMLERLTKSLAYEKRAYLLALQSQMDPHFLYNILSIISGMGLESGNDDIADVCGKISALMRYNASFDNNNVTLGDEITHAKNYLELMKVRYEDYFVYSIHANEDLLQMRMPRQVLQPILENCFEHGFKSVPPVWRIEINADIKDGRWYISISDNGAGFGDAELLELDKKLEEYSKNLPENYHELKIGGLGLINTILRLKLLMGEGVEYQARKNTPRGTIIILQEGKNINDKDTDS